jgi:hypothetical protein
MTQHYCRTEWGRLLENRKLVDSDSVDIDKNTADILRKQALWAVFQQLDEWLLR